MGTLDDTSAERLAAASERWREAVDEAARAKAALVLVVEECIGAGAGERAVASAAGVQRGTIRAWVGK